MWSNDTHPNAFPSDGHFSSILGISHEGDYSMWGPGMNATPGVKEVAENGNVTVLEKELMMAIMYKKTAWKTFKAPGPINGTQHVMNLGVEVTKDFPLVSLITMIAPSPDWFTGIMNMNLCNTSSGMWLDSMMVDMLHPWDAGTDDGTAFDAADAATNPVETISIITAASDTPFNNSAMGMIATLGKVMITRINKPAMTMCSGEGTYKVEIQTMWTQESHPNGFPQSAHFSPPVGATHSYKYKFWSPMTRASTGVKMVAETGATDTLYNEIKNYKKPGYVHMAYKASAEVKTPGTWSMMVSVKGVYSKVSLITMLAPSPDWFIGVDSYDLCGSNGEWKKSGMMSLPAWDAGTDSGMNFMSQNSPTTPPDVITLITASSNTEIKENANTPFAKISFTLQEGNETPSDSKASTQIQPIYSLLACACLAILRLLN